ncbi:hypothetical protein JN11_04291 [Mucilaginibacter frigoritolerans]|uniref:DUF1570 domain-containing protein n=1 Tax=Mucilaginibacter frigoritolerans TaxID=652788 RepID=A0A562TPW3_9SPHI|nr:hypothetical protein [Mucilaginibacter frigoritolerans]TWI95552.1 hypothetical protein JN11_04291 [Mucilaginibacter frigoritolerans]
MKKLLPLVFCCVAFTCRAQTAETAVKLAASYFKEAETASQGQHVWNKKVYGPMMFVEPRTRITYANIPDSAGILKPDGEIYRGVLPETVMIANTSINWEGKMWSVMLWPLLADRDERVNLMIHESFHRIQAELGLPERSPTVDHLSTFYGRIYFLLELQALKAALLKPVDQRNADLTNALLFRQKRRELFPSTFKNEQILEMSEGLAEYTGVILGRPKDHIRQHLYDQIDTAGNRKSFIRSCAYITGPVYGYLIFEKSPYWTLKVDSNSDFPELISQYYHLKPAKTPDEQTIARLEKKYNGDVIIKSETLKEQKRLQLVNQYVDLFTKEPVLTIKLIKMGISFNPNNLFDLGEYGTVYPTAEIKDTWGELTVSATGMLMKDWQIVYLPMSKAPDINGNTIEGEGWKISLNTGWKFSKIDALHYQLTQ